MIRYLRGYLYKEPTSWASLYVFIDDVISVCGFPTSRNLKRSTLTTINYSVRFLLVLLWPIFAINASLNQATKNTRFDAILAICGGFHILIKFLFLWLLKDERIKLSGRVLIMTSSTDAASDRYEKISQKYCRLSSYFPYSSATAECVFSVMNDVKLKKRNRLNFKTREDLCIESSKIAALNLILYILGTTIHTIISLIETKHEWKLPLEMTIIGIPYHNYLGYAINLVIQVLQFIVAVPALLGFDLSFISYCLFTVSRLELCKSYCIFIGDKTSEYDTEYKQEQLLKSLIKMQSDAINFLNQFKTIFENYILVHMLILTRLLSQALFQILREIQFSPLITFAIVFVQILIYSIFGQMIITKSEELVKAIYDSNWYELRDISNRKMVFLMLLNAQQNQRFVIRGFFNLSLEKFTEILKTAYVFAAFLRKII